MFDLMLIVRIVRDLKFMILLLLSIFAFHYALQAELYVEIELGFRNFTNAKGYKMKFFSTVVFA